MSHLTVCHFGDESSQTINCTGADNEKGKKTSTRNQKNNTENMPYLTVTEATTNEVHCPGSSISFLN